MASQKDRTHLIVKKTIEVQQKRVEYTLRLSKRARRLRLRVRVGGEVFVSAPQAMKESRIEKFIVEKSEWLIKKIAQLSKFPKRVFIKNRRRHFLEHKARATVLAKERLLHFNQFYKFAWSSISVRNQTSRWGSCSRKGNLNFNYKLVLLPAHLSDYVFVHELCHLGELNHSVKFWNLVAKTMPNYRELRKELRRISVSLG